ncbi:hypothetical protein [Zhengella mangrovi]|uniref:hypothetical protein n=1 Tax=Zhengella mangrovi TaxID=1982044 RepID=UPI001055D2F4|nr:hypothetical protein [Zhengella mangrovi]
MSVDLITVDQNSNDLARPGILRGDIAAIAADPNVWAYWPARSQFINNGLDFAWRDAKQGSRAFHLRPSVYGYQPSVQTDGVTGMPYLRFGQGSNPGAAGGSLSDSYNGALQTRNDALVFPMQDPTTTVGIFRPYAIVCRVRIPATADDGGDYPGAVAGCACRHDDTPGVNQNDWAGIRVGFGGSSQSYVSYAWRGDVGYCTLADNRVNGEWQTVTGIFDPDAGVAKLRITSGSGIATEVDSDTIVQKHATRTGHTQLRVGAAGDLGEAIHRTLIGDIGSLAIIHAACASGSGLTTLQNIEDLFGDDLLN